MLLSLDWWAWHDCDPVYFENPKSFIFLDIEYGGSNALKVINESLRNMDNDYYIFNSGGGLHVVIDKLVSLDKLPREYGKILVNFGLAQNSFGLFDWGNLLMQAGPDHEKINQWCTDVLSNCGYKNQAVKDYKEVYLIDLRHLAHSLLRLEKNVKYKKHTTNICGKDRTIYERFGAANLRVSEAYKKYKQPPMLIYKKENNVESSFENLFFESPTLFDINADNLNSCISSTQYESIYLQKFNSLFINNNFENISVDNILSNEGYRYDLRTKIFSLFVTMDAAACNGHVDNDYLVNRDKKLIELNSCFKLLEIPEVKYDEDIEPLDILFELKMRSFQALEKLSCPSELLVDKIKIQKDATDRFEDIQKRVNHILDEEDVWGIYGSALKVKNPNDIDVLLIVENIDKEKYRKIIKEVGRTIESPKISLQIIPKRYLDTFWVSDDHDMFNRENFCLIGGDGLSINKRDDDHVIESYLASEEKANNILKQAKFLRTRLATSFDIVPGEAKTPERWTKKEGEYFLKRELFKVYIEMKNMLYETRNYWKNIL